MGGAVRDALLGRLKDNPDLDLTVPRGAIQLCRQLASRWGGTVVVLDQARDMGRLVHGPWTVDVAAWDGATMEADLWRRDFSLNAMAYHLRRRTFHDPCGGLQDLVLRRLRCVAAANLAADPLRVLRAYRLAAELECTIEERTRQWLQQEAPKLGLVASERVLAELERLCGAPQAHHWLIETGTVLQTWLPMVRPWPGLKCLSHRLARALDLERKSLAGQLALARLSGVLGAQSAVERLGCSRRRQRQWQRLNHWRQVWAASMARLTEDQQVQLHLDLTTDLPALLLVLLAQNRLSLEEAKMWLYRWQDPADSLCHPHCPLSGHRLQEALSLSPSPRLGALMAFLRHENAFGRLAAHDEASILDSARQWLQQAADSRQMPGRKKPESS
ncbi:tRNA nucleotidyltransferase, CC-adding (EC 2.7.7.21) [Candidatus Synechococcus spongiarum]|uniref:tRNA nucleotidyltransferase, CC-adding n=1 Tax=Candidatus Synechococcus spongiarum TaxID=431041 RepID=A0A165B260_9SYNE|nr:tRNA nucleotidyltransferase, CC-adding (EC 2.7.7.21) [Candidatus Synechococcus spongiarum]